MPSPVRVGTWFACALVLTAAAAAQEAPSLSAAQLVEMIVRDGAQARAIRLRVDVVRREQAARAVLPNPSIAYAREGAGYTEFLQAEQLLPIFGSRGALLRAGAAATSAAEAERDGRLWQLRTEAEAIVARLLAEQEKVDASATTIQEVERIIALLRIREQEGEGARFDRLRAEQELSEARQIGLDATATAAGARASISSMMTGDGRIGRVSGALYVSRDVLPLAALLERAISTRGELRALTAESNRYELEAVAARRAKLPAPTVAAGLKRAGDAGRRESGGVIGVNVTLPLFDTGGREAARWLAERDRVDAERAVMTQTIRAQVTAAADVLALRRGAADAADLASSADDLAKIAEVAYTEGDASILELLDAHRTSARARIRIIEMRLAARLAEITLARAVGDTIWP